MVNRPGGSSRLSMDVPCPTSRGPSIIWVCAPYWLHENCLLTNYEAPEYALDEALNTASDLYSLGCLIFAVHCKGDPPFKTHGSLGGLRDAAGRPLNGISGLDRDLQGVDACSTFLAGET